MQNYLSSRGYVIHKDSLTPLQLTSIKNELTVTPYIPEGYGDKPESFKTYNESSSKIYVPKAYGLLKFGVPSFSKLPDGDDINLEFTGRVRPEQEKPIDAVIEACRDPKRMGGLLCLQCGQGKTVCAINIMCVLAKKTLIIVHKEFLLQQWKERILEFAPAARIGLIKAKTVDIEDKDVVIASLQSLSMKKYEDSVFVKFGTLIVDEAHHTGAQVFSQALKKVNFKYSIGLTATPTRKDGMTKVFIWFMGDIVFGTKKRQDDVRVVIKQYYNANPAYSREHMMYNKKPNLSKMINSICEFGTRSEFIVQQINDLFANEPKRRILLLSDRRQHLENLKKLLDEAQLECGFYYGGLGPEELKRSESKRIILGTYQYSSEGFDVKGLDTLVLASPKSDVIQVVGRILRAKPEDRLHQPLIIDIVDDFSVFPNQGKKRYKYYKSCKFVIDDECGIAKPIKKIELPKNQCLISD